MEKTTKHLSPSHVQKAPTETEGPVKNSSRPWDVSARVQTRSGEQNKEVLLASYRELVEKHHTPNSTRGEIASSWMDVPTTKSIQGLGLISFSSLPCSQKAHRKFCTKTDYIFKL
jgi:hypothetical protein